MTTTNPAHARYPALLRAAIIAGLMATAGCFSALSQPDVVAWLQFRTEPGADRAMADQQKKSMLKLLTSPFVLASALKQPGVAELETVRDQKDPVMWLSRSLEVVAQADSDVVKVRLRGQRPAEMDAIRTKARDLAQARVDLKARRTSVESLEHVTEQLGLQLEATAVELSAPSRVRLVEAATAPAGAGP